MKLSIITICLNEKNIERTCKSIVSQTFKDFEWIVIDGKSDKQTVNKINKYKDKISIFISENDSGIYDAMNKGILLAKGDYISFMNAGDTFYSKNTISEIFNNKIYTDDIIYGNINIIKNKKSFIEINPKYITKQFLLNGVINHQACFIKRNLFYKYGLYNMYYRITADYEKLLCWNSFDCSFLYVDKTIAKHYRNGCSSNKHLVNLERKKIQKIYFSNDEKEIFNNKYKFKLFGIKLLSVKDIFPKTYINLFGILPIIKIKNNLIYLFGLNFLPILKLKEKINE